MKNKIFKTIFFLAINFGLTAQNVAISEDNSTPDPSAMLDIQSPDKGLLIPRVTLMDVNTPAPVSSPANGLFVYSESGAVPDGLYYWNSNNSKWGYVITANDITDFGSGQVITDSERSLVNSALQAESDPVFTAHPANNITNAGSGQIITNSERSLVNSAIQNESDPVYTSQPAASITNAGSGQVITGTERSTLNSAIQSLSGHNATELDDISNAGSGEIITNNERDKLTGLQNNPPGTILVYAGENLPAGYLWCDGTPYLRTSYPELFNAIGENWGEGDGTNTFNVPDLRGQFLRGMDRDNGNGLANNDPDIANRTNIEGTTVGNVIGSYQEDAFQGHHHDFNRYINNLYASGSDLSGYAWNSNQSDQVLDPEDDGINGTPRTSSETRPKNAYVNYIIKY